MKAEPEVQQRFSVLRLAGMATIFAITLSAHAVFRTLPDREELGPRMAELRFEPVRFDAESFAPLRVAGAWKIESDDPRFGGLSALAFDNGTFVALTDSGAVVRFARPAGPSGTAIVRELPGGPGDPNRKMNRDSEALVQDPDGRGWWVAFETRNELWLYNDTFTRELTRLTIPRRRLKVNRGIEGITSSRSGLLLLPESGGRLLRLARDSWSEISLDFAPRRSSDVASLGDGSLLVIERRLTLLGIANALVRLVPCPSGYCLDWRRELPLGPIDNVEGIAVEPLPSGGSRLWLVTDDDWAAPRRTLLLELVLAPAD